MPDSRDLFGAVFADGSRHGISCDDLCNLRSIGYVGYRHFEDPAIHLHAHACRVALG